MPNVRVIYIDAAPEDCNGQQQGRIVDIVTDPTHEIRYKSGGCMDHTDEIILTDEELEDLCCGKCLIDVATKEIISGVDIARTENHEEELLAAAEIEERLSELNGN